MGLSSKTYDKVRAKVKAEAWAKVKCVALIHGDMVLSTHRDFSDGNIALCKAHEAKEAADDNSPNTFDLIPLSYIPNPGQKVDRRNTVWLP